LLLPRLLVQTKLSASITVTSSKSIYIGNNETSFISLKSKAWDKAIKPWKNILANSAIGKPVTELPGNNNQIVNWSGLNAGVKIE